MLPDSSTIGPLMGPVNINLPAEVSIDRDRSQNVPAGAPAGTYSYNAYVGVYPDTIWDCDAFSFEKLETGNRGPGGDDWGNWGEDFGGAANEGLLNQAPTNLASIDVFPNPFNPNTTFAFYLPQDCWVRLQVFDVCGRIVGAIHELPRPMVDGWRQAGIHKVAFAGSGLPAGIYIYRLRAGEFSISGKMLLLK